MVGVWEGLNLGSIPDDHMPSQKDPKISIERRCSTILPLKQIAMWIDVGNTAQASKGNESKAEIKRVPSY